MNPKLVFDADALSLRVCETHKFKAGLLSVSAALPIDRKKAPLITLLLAVLRRGTVKYPTLELLNRRLDYLWGAELSIRNFYRGDCQILGFTVELLDSAFLPCTEEDPLTAVLDAVCQILFHPLLDEHGYLSQKYVESEKQFQCESIRSLKNNPRSYAAERFSELLFCNDACGAPMWGTEEEIMAVTAEDLTSLWHELISALSFSCFYVGAEKPETLSRALYGTLGSELERRDRKTAIACKEAVKAVTALPSPVMHTEKIEAGQSHLLLGFTTNATASTPDFYACAVLNELLGASPTSRLFLNVREKLSLCYHCASAYNSFKGTLTVHCGLHRDNRARAEEEILSQLAQIVAGEYNEDELTAAKRSLVSVYRQTEDNPASTESFYFRRALANRKETLEDAIAIINTVTKEDVTAVAQRLSLHTVYFLEGTLANEEEEDNDEDD